MKKYRTKPWAKGLACGLFVLAMTVSVICLGNVRWLAYHGGYQWEGTRQLVEEEEAVWVENLTNQLADGYRSYRDGDQSLDVKRYVEDENFFFTIKDLEGNTLLASDTLGDYREKTSWSMQVGGTVQWSHIDQYYDSYEARDLALDQLGSTYEELQNVSLVEDEEGYRLTADVARTVGKETVVLTGFLRSELSPTGQVYQGIQYAENMGFYRYEFLAGAILGLVLGLLSLGFLLWSAAAPGGLGGGFPPLDGPGHPHGPADRGGGGSSAVWASAGGLLQRLGHLPGGLWAHGTDHGADGGCAGHGPLPGPAGGEGELGGRTCSSPA